MPSSRRTELPIIIARNNLLLIIIANCVPTKNQNNINKELRA